jgi:hypothetical protein
MGRILTLNFLGTSELLFLRLFNIPFAFATIFFVWRMLQLLTNDRLTQLLLMIMMTNTIMFSFLSASVSYDNMTNALAAMAIYYLLAFFKTRTGNMLTASVLCQLAGTLTKITFLPLVLVMNILLFIHEFKNINNLSASLKNYIHTSGKGGLVMIVAIFFMCILNIQLYGENIVKYGKIIPSLSQVISHDHAMKNRIYARNIIYSAFKEKRISLDKALEMTSQYFKSELDRKMNIKMISDYMEHKKSGKPLLNPFEYMGLWSLRMMATIFGVEWSMNMLNKGIFIPIFIVWIMMAGLGALIRYHSPEAGRLPFFLAVIAVFYSLFLMYAVNYPIYLKAEIFNLAVQGRYIFPVIGPLYILWSYYLLRLFKERNARVIIFFVTALIFIASDLPYFIVHTTPECIAIAFN